VSTNNQKESIMLKSRLWHIVALVIGLLAFMPAMASADLSDPTCINDVLQLSTPAISTRTDVALTAPEVGWSTTIDLAAADALPVRTFDLYRSYRVPWPRSL
jgi:hypothetical protein